MKKGILNILLIFILFMLGTTISNAAELSETEKNKILEFMENNDHFSYHNYDKVENICIGASLLGETSCIRVTDEQRKNPEIYEMVGDYDEGVFVTREKLNEYLQSTIGITVDKLKNYEQFLKWTTTSDNKNQFYYFRITGPSYCTDYKITNIEETTSGTIKVTITAKLDQESFSNVIELVRKGDSYNFVSSTSADGKNRVSGVTSENIFNKKEIKNTTSAEESKKDDTVAKTEIPQAGIVGNVIIASVLAILMVTMLGLVIRYKKRKDI